MSRTGTSSIGGYSAQYHNTKWYKLEFGFEIKGNKHFNLSICHKYNNQLCPGLGLCVMSGPQFAHLKNEEIYTSSSPFLESWIILKSLKINK